MLDPIQIFEIAALSAIRESQCENDPPNEEHDIGDCLNDNDPYAPWIKHESAVNPPLALIVDLAVKGIHSILQVILNRSLPSAPAGLVRHVHKRQ